METKTLKDWVDLLRGASAEVRTIISEVGGHVLAAERVRADMARIDHDEITAWARELRKNDALDPENAARVICTWMTESRLESGTRATNLTSALSSIGGPLVNLFLPLIAGKFQGWFGGDGEVN